MTGSVQMLFGGGGGIAAAFAAAVDKEVGGTLSGNVTITLNTDGTIVGSESGYIGGFQDFATGLRWYMPPTAGIGSAYWVQATLASGTVPNSGPAMGVWTQVSAAVAWTYNSGAGSLGTNSMRAGILNIKFSTNAAGTAIIGPTSTMSFDTRRISGPVT